MPRWSLATVCLGLCACAAGGRSEGDAFGDAGPSLLAAPAPVWQLQSIPRATEGRLRTRLATDLDPTEAALELVWLMDRAERHPQALMVLDAALRRAPDVDALRAARAGILRDLGMRHEAVAALVALMADRGVREMHPGLLVELAELQGLEGQRLAGQQTLVALRTHHANHEWVLTRAAQLADLELSLQSPTPDRIRVRDLLGNLRGCPEAGERLLAFEALSEVGGEARARAEGLLLEDPDPALRARAVADAEVLLEVLGAFCAAALQDPSAQVRAAAAARATALPAAEVAALLLPSMTTEASAEAFCAMHTVLRRVAGTGNDLSVEAASDPLQRAAVLAEWRKQWEM